MGEEMGFARRNRSNQSRPLSVEERSTINLDGFHQQTVVASFNRTLEKAHIDAHQLVVQREVSVQREHCAAR